MAERPWHSRSPDEVLSALESSHSGLSSSEARSRFEGYGPNQLEQKKKTPPWVLFVRQFASPLVYVLLAASILKFAIGAYLDAGVILAVLVFMAMTGYVQESRAERAMEALMLMAAPKAKVRRDGAVQMIPAREVVPGDVLVLEAGDKVSADGRLVESSNLQITEASLTGESVPIDKHKTVLEADTPLADRKNMVFSGTTVTRGRATIAVVATGMKTEIGKIAGAIGEMEAGKTPLQRGIAKLSNYILLAVLLVAGLLIGVGLWRGLDLTETLLLAVAAAVAAVPEGLPAAVTVVLATGMRFMAGRNAIIRKLVAVETLGSATVICSDKTGTLTLGEMTARRIFTGNRWLEITGSGYNPEGDFRENGAKIDPNDDIDLETMLRVGVLCNDSLLVADSDWSIMGDPTEGAIVVAAAKAGIEKEKLESAHPRLDEIPFQSERRYMATLHHVDGKRVAYIKGAPERILSMSCHYLRNGDMAPLEDADKERIEKASNQMAEQAMRVMAIAYADHPGEMAELHEKEITGCIVFLGLIGMADPPREEAKRAVKACKRAGIKVVMVTGDNRVTASAIAQQLELPKGETLTGAELERMSDEALEAEIDDVSVFARIDPLHKLRIVKSFQSMGHTVAMTGDGINDAPALKQADIGIAMGVTGTDVAKEASQMVLADDNFASVVAAVEEGRAIFTRLRNVTLFLLSAGMGELLAIVFGVLILGEAPLLALQVLWINLVTGVIMAIPLGFEPKAGDELEYPPRHPRVGLLYRGMMLRIAFLATMLGGGVLVLFDWTRAGELGEARTIAFCSVVVFEWLMAFNARSDRYTMFRLGILGNRSLLIAVSAALLLQIAVVYVPFLQEAFGTVPLGIREWGIAIIPGLAIFIIETLRKLAFPDLFAMGKWRP